MTSSHYDSLLVRSNPPAIVSIVEIAEKGADKIVGQPNVSR